MGEETVSLSYFTSKHLKKKSKQASKYRVLISLLAHKGQGAATTGMKSARDEDETRFLLDGESGSGHAAWAARGRCFEPVRSR